MKSILPENCILNSFKLISGRELISTSSLNGLLKRCGSPVATLQELLYGDSNLPEGAVPHLLSTSEDERPTMSHIFREFKDVFPSELPRNTPPDRKLGDVHDIPLE